MLELLKNSETFFFLLEHVSFITLQKECITCHLRQESEHVCCFEAVEIGSPVIKELPNCSVSGASRRCTFFLFMTLWCMPASYWLVGLSLPLLFLLHISVLCFCVMHVCFSCSVPPMCFW